MLRIDQYDGMNHKNFINNLLGYFGDEISSNDAFIANLTKCLPDLHKLIDMNSPARTRPSWLKEVMKVYERVAMEELPKYVALSYNPKDLRGVCFDCCYVLLYIQKKQLREDSETMEQFLVRFPEFAAIEMEERVTLKAFEFMMSAAQKCIHPNEQKQKLLEICTHLTEGNFKKYITGKGQTVATANRVLIYERLAGNNYRKRKFAAAQTQNVDLGVVYCPPPPANLSVGALGGDIIERSYSMMLRNWSAASPTMIRSWTSSSSDWLIYDESLKPSEPDSQPNNSTKRAKIIREPSFGL